MAAARLPGLLALALGEIVAVEIVRGFAYAPYEGGPLPPWYRDAGYPFRDAGARGLAIVQALLGPIAGVDATWASRDRDPNVPFDEWRARVTCERGTGTLELAYGATSHVTVRGTRRALRVPRAIVDTLVAARAGDAATAAAAQVATWAERIARRADGDYLARLAGLARSERVPFLVTGAAGSLGRAIVERLVADGHAVRAFVRRIPEQPRPGVEYCVGNLGDPDAVDRAVAGAEIVIHAGAAMKGGWPEHKLGTVAGTANVIAACERRGAKQLVYISSMSVIDWAGSAGAAAVDEAAALEPRAGERGAYTRAKLEAEQLVASAARDRGLPAVILRPGQIFGGGIPLINGAVARSAAGRWLVLGDGALELPLVYMDDVIDAIGAAIEQRLAHGEVIQIIDPEHLTQADVLALAGGGKPIVNVPRSIVFALGALSELPLRALGRQSPVARYRLASALARLHYESDRAHALLGWTPRVGVREGIRRVSPR